MLRIITALRHVTQGRHCSSIAGLRNRGSMTVVVFTVHDVSSPRVETHILRNLLDYFRLAVDDHDRVLSRIGEVNLLILRVGRRRLELNVYTDPDATGRPESIHVIDV